MGPHGWRLPGETPADASRARVRHCRLAGCRAAAWRSRLLAWPWHPDPVGVLQAAGFTRDDAREFSQELIVTDIEQHMTCTYTCDRYTRWVTRCGNVPPTN